MGDVSRREEILENEASDRKKTYLARECDFDDHRVDEVLPVTLFLLVSEEAKAIAEERWKLKWRLQLDGLRSRHIKVHDRTNSIYNLQTSYYLNIRTIYIYILN